MGRKSSCDKWKVLCNKCVSKKVEHKYKVVTIVKKKPIVTKKYKVVKEGCFKTCDVKKHKLSSSSSCSKSSKSCSKSSKSCSCTKSSYSKSNKKN